MNSLGFELSSFIWVWLSQCFLLIKYAGGALRNPHLTESNHNVWFNDCKIQFPNGSCWCVYWSISRSKSCALTGRELQMIAPMQEIKNNLILIEIIRIWERNNWSATGEKYGFWKWNVTFFFTFWFDLLYVLRRKESDIPWESFGFENRRAKTIRIDVQSLLFPKNLTICCAKNENILIPWESLGFENERRQELYDFRRTLRFRTLNWENENILIIWESLGFDRSTIARRRRKITGFWLIFWWFCFVFWCFWPDFPYVLGACGAQILFVFLKT